MSEPKAALYYKDYPSVEAVEATLADPSSRWRVELTFWEYAIVRASVMNRKAPVPGDGSGFDKPDILAHPAAIALILTLTAAVAVFFVLIPIETPIVYLGPALAAMTQLWQFGPSARARRLVWSAVNMSPEERLAALSRAAQLQPWWS